MADWYCGSVQYTAVTQFAVSHAYSVGDIVRQLATPTVGNERCFRCTTAGTSAATEPTWVLTKAATTTTGTATFTEVTGNSTYNWSAPHSRIGSAYTNGYSTAADRVFVAHNHAETSSANIAISNTLGSQQTPIFVYCVNASGSVPPVSADLRTTATVTTTGTTQIQIHNGTAGVGYFYGIGFVSSNGFRVGVAGGNFTELAFDSCSFTFTGGSSFLAGAVTNGAASLNKLINTPIIFSAITQGIIPNGDFVWKDTPSAIGAGTVPTSLFIPSSSTTYGGNVLVEGVDLSAVNTTLFGDPSVVGGNIRSQMVNCRLNASVTVNATIQLRSQDIYLFGCGSASNSSRNEKHTYDGDLTTEATIVLAASDGTTPVSWKTVTVSRGNKLFQFECPSIAIWNATTGSAKTLTVEIVNDGTTMKDDEIWVEVEYLGSSSTPVSSKVTSRATDHLATGANVPTSTAAWTTTGLTTPIKQKMSVTFTPQMAGLVRATVCIATVSKTIYVDPKVTIT